MIDIHTWMHTFVQRVEQTFADRVWFIGLQGSYGRGEATDASDIDVVVILDEIQLADLNTYRNMLDTLPHRELVCGFVSGKDQLFSWEASDLFQFCYDTTPIKGTLTPLMQHIDRDAVRRAARIGACNIYHACVHNFVHERSDDVLRSLYKAAIFVMQAMHFYKTGHYIQSSTELQNAFDPPSAVLDTALKLKHGGSISFDGTSPDSDPFDKMSDLLLRWAGAVIVEYQE